MGRFLFLLFLIVPLVEIALFVVIGGVIGLWPTLAGVLVTAVAGSLILRWQGLSIINEIRSSVGHGQLPARALADAMMIGLAGVLLLTPGYFTDLLGILLLIPPLRSAIYAYLRARVKVVATTGGSGFTYGTRRVDDGTVDLDSDEWRKR